MNRRYTRIPGLVVLEELPRDGSWGSLSGYIETSYERLHQLLGEPRDITGGDGKVSTSWRGFFGERKFEIYDYKETNMWSERMPSVQKFRVRSKYMWHVRLEGSDPVWASKFLKTIALATGGSPIELWKR